MIFALIDNITTFSVKYPMYFYGFRYFDTNVGHYGILAFIVEMFARMIECDQCACFKSTEDLQTRKIVRTMRTSMLCFVKNLNQSNHQISDGPFWKSLTLTMMGFYSFCCLKPTLLDTAYTSVNNSYQKLRYIQKYLCTYVVPYMEPNISSVVNDTYPFIQNTAFHHTVLKKADIPQFNTFCFGVSHCYYALIGSSIVLGNTSKYMYYEQQIAQALMTGVFYHDFALKMCQTIADVNKNPSLMTPEIFENVVFIIQLYQQRLERCKWEIDIIKSAIHRNAILNQSNEWLCHVVDENTRQHELYIKWKNATCIKYCHYCNKIDSKLFKCKKCQKVYYCSRLCQKKDWNLKRHRMSCL